jgi:hypothetical protein
MKSISAKRFGRRGADLEQVVVHAGHVEAFEHFGATEDSFDEGFAVDRFFQADADEGSDVEAQFAGRKDTGIALNYAGIFQFLDSFTDGGGAQIERFGDLRVADAPVFLKKIHDANIDVIHGNRSCAGGV